MSEQQPPRVRHNEFRPPRAHHLVSVASMCALLIGAAACGSDSKQATAPGHAGAGGGRNRGFCYYRCYYHHDPRGDHDDRAGDDHDSRSENCDGQGHVRWHPGGTVARAACGRRVGHGHWRSRVDGDLVGQETYTAAFSPADAAGVITERGRRHVHRHARRCRRRLVQLARGGPPGQRPQLGNRIPGRRLGRVRGFDGHAALDTHRRRTRHLRIRVRVGVTQAGSCWSCSLLNRWKAKSTSLDLFIDRP